MNEKVKSTQEYHQTLGFTIKGAALFMELFYGTIQKRIKSELNPLPATKEGGQYRIQEADLLAWKPKTYHKLPSGKRLIEMMSNEGWTATQLAKEYSVTPNAIFQKKFRYKLSLEKEIQEKIT